jgi:hypothetical protein
MKLRAAFKMRLEAIYIAERRRNNRRYTKCGGNCHTLDGDVPNITTMIRLVRHPTGRGLAVVARYVGLVTWAAGLCVGSVCVLPWIYG